MKVEKTFTSLYIKYKIGIKYTSPQHNKLMYSKLSRVKSNINFMLAKSCILFMFAVLQYDRMLYQKKY